MGKIMRRKKRLKYLAIGICVSSLLVLFQNCTGGFDTRGKSASFASLASEQQFLAAKSVLENRCVSCHNAAGSVSQTPLDFSHEEEFVASGLVVPGKLAESRLITRLKNYPENIPGRDMPTGGELTNAEYETLRQWVLGIGATDGPFLCKTPSQGDPIIEHNAKRMTKSQYTNSVYSLLQQAFSKSEADSIFSALKVDQNIPEDQGGRYSRSDSAIGNFHAKGYFVVADEFAKQVTKSSNRLSKFAGKYIELSELTCSPNFSATQLSEDCQKAFISGWILNAFSRPALDETDLNEVEDLLASYQQEGNTVDSVSRVVFRSLLSPQFLLRPQIDSELVDAGDNIYRLSSYGIASRLSLVLSNRLPGSELLSKASSADLFDQKEFQNAIELALGQNVLLGDGIEEFTEEWLHLDKLEDFVDTDSAKFQYVFSGINADESLKQAMVSEITEMMTYYFDHGGSLKDLMTSDISFARHPGLMKIYGQSNAAPQPVTESNAARFPASERSGLLTRAGMLYSGGGDTERPIMRGVKIREELLCLDLGDPPPLEADPPPPANKTVYTTRELFHENTKPSQCMSCHQYINPLGFALSHFNALGGYQQKEPIFDNSGMLLTHIDVDASVDLSIALGTNTQVDNAVDFNQVISGNRDLKTCTTKNLYSFVYETADHPEGSSEGCSLNKMYNALENGDLKSFILQSLSTNSFKMRKIN